MAVNRSTLVFRHVFIDSKRRVPFATARVTALVMSHETRRAMSISDAMRAGAEAVLVKG